MQKQWRSLVLDWFWLVVASLLEAIAVVLFLAPFEIAPSGVAGVAVILNTLVGTPIGIMIILLNIPIQIFALRVLPNGFRVVWRTAATVVLYSLLIDWLTPFVPIGGISQDRLLNAVFGGVVLGIASGLIYRVGSTFGGTSTLALLLQRHTGTPMSTTYLYTDVSTVFLAGFVYGWEGALYATVVIFISGLATDYILEGPSVIRTVVIITDKPQEVANVIMHTLGRGVTGWDAVGMYTQQKRSMLYVTISRSQMPDLKRMVMQIDPQAFLVVGQGHRAYGKGFQRE